MNVAKNWALLLTEQIIIPVKKNGKQRWSYRRKLCQKKSGEISCFLLIVSWGSFPPKFPVKSANFSKNFDFSPAKSADFSVNLDFFPVKIPRNRPIFP